MFKVTIIGQVCIHCNLSVKKRRMVCEDLGGILFVLVSTCVISKNMNIPNWSSMTENTIKLGGIGVLGYPVYFYICE